MSVKPSRTALVAFFNDALQLNIAKVDDLGNGAVYCQLLDSIYGDIPMQRVKFDTRSPLEMEQNYKVLQQAFIKHKLDKTIDSHRLMKCRLQDNLDFSQWLYQFWHESSHIDGYDPVARRSGQGGNSTKVRRAPSVMLSSKVTAGPQPQAPMPPSSSNPMRSVPVQAPELTPSRTPSRSKFSTYNAPPITSAATQRIGALEAEIDELGKTVDVLVEERDLYYEKLLDIEQLMNHQIDRFYTTQGNTAAMEHSTDPMLLLIRKIQEILFSSPEGFQPQIRPEDEPF